MFERRWTHATSIALVGLIGFLGTNSCARKPPQAAIENILVICVDVLRADHVSAYGNPRTTTPWIDRLARSGVAFENVTSAASWTKPSVPSYFTGRFPHQHGVYEGSRNEGGVLVSDTLPAEETTMAEVFEAAGYRTSAFVNNAQIDGVLGFSQGFEVYADDSGDATDIRERFFHWLDDVGPEEGFFSYLHFLDVHWPYAPEGVYREIFDPARSTIDFFTPAWKTLKRNIREGSIVLSEQDRQAMIDLYDSELRYTDTEIGNVLQGLARRGLLENTLVVLLSDHGEEFLDHGGIGHGNGLFSELVAVPLVMRFPDSEHAGKRIAQPVSMVDVLPTLCEICGTEKPDGLAGQSFLPLLNDEPMAPRPIYIEGIHGDRYQQAVVADGWKYVATVYLPDDDDVEDAPDFRHKIGRGTRIEIEGILADDGMLLAEEVILQDDQQDERDKITGTIERISAEGTELAVLGYRVSLDDDCDLEDENGDELLPQDLRVGDAVKVYGRAENSRRFRAEKAKRRDSDRRRKTKIEGPVQAAPETSDGKTMLVRVAGRTIRIDRGSEVLTQDWQRVLDERRKQADSKAPAANTGADPLAIAIEHGIPVEHALYDLDRDPQELVDLATIEPSRLEAMRALLETLRVPSENRRGAGRALDANDEERLRELGYIK